MQAGLQQHRQVLQQTPQQQMIEATCRALSQMPASSDDDEQRQRLNSRFHPCVHVAGLPVQDVPEAQAQPKHPGLQSVRVVPPGAVGREQPVIRELLAGQAGVTQPGRHRRALPAQDRPRRQIQFQIRGALLQVQ